MTNSDLISIGFKELPHRTIGGSVVYDLGRNRNLSVQNAGNPNEFMWIYEVDSDNETEITDLVCISNYDYDGYLTIEKVKMLISTITGILDKK